MDSTTINVKAESFPWQVKFLGMIFFIAGAAVLVSYWWLSLILWFISLFLLTGHSGTTIDREAMTYREYNSYFFIKNGETKRYNDVEKIFINSSNESQKIYTAHTLDSSTFTNTVYNAWLKFDNGVKIFLTTQKSKEALSKKLYPISKFLNTEIEDYS